MKSDLSSGLSDHLNFYQQQLRTQFHNSISLQEAFLERQVEGTLTSLRSRPLAGITVSVLDNRFGYTAFNKGSRDREENICFTFLEAGRALSLQNGEESLLTPQNILVYSNARNAHWRFENAFKETVVQVPINIIRERYPNIFGLIGKVIPRTANSNLIISLAQMYTSLSAQEQYSEAAVSMLRESVLDLILQELSHVCANPSLGAGNRNVQLLMVKDFILKNLSDTELNVTKIAAFNHVSVRTLHALFAKNSLQVMDFVWNARLEKAAWDVRNLHLTGLSLAEIAYKNGFKSPSHFSARFKEKFGKTPKEASCSN